MARTKIPDSGSSADLPKPNEPLKLPDGTLIYPDGRIDYVTVPKHSDAQALVTSTNRKLADMPATPEAMSVPGLILLYKLSGLDDAEISVAMQIPIETISRILMSDMVSQLYSFVREHILENDGEVVSNILRAGAKSAAIKMVKLSQHALPAVAMTAAKDVLDRTGYKTKDVVQHQFDDLRIVVVDDSDVNMKMLDVTPRRIG